MEQWMIQLSLQSMVLLKYRKKTLKAEFFVAFGLSEITNQDIKINVFLLFHSIQRFRKFSRYEAELCTRWAFNLLYVGHWNPETCPQSCSKK